MKPRARAMGHPFMTRVRSVPYPILRFFAHWATVSVSPSWVRNREDRRLLACASRPAHVQLSGLYPLLLSLRSNVIPSARSPISAKNNAKSFHRSQTVTPRPPYLGYAGFCGFWHRCLIAAQMRNVGVLLFPCFRVMSANLVRPPQPQVITAPAFKWLARTSFRTPQAHAHSHLGGCEFATCLTATRLPKRRPKRFSGFNPRISDYIACPQT